MLWRMPGRLRMAARSALSNAMRRKIAIQGVVAADDDFDRRGDAGLLRCGKQAVRRQHPRRRSCAGMGIDERRGSSGDGRGIVTGGMPEDQRRAAGGGIGGKSRRQEAIAVSDSRIGNDSAAHRRYPQK